MRVLIALSLFGLAMAASTHLKPESRISNGQIVPESDKTWRFQVSIRQAGFHMCGGVVLSAHFILTSATCVAAQSEKLLQVWYGSYNRKSNGLLASVYKIHVNPEFEHGRSNLDGDLAILQLYAPGLVSGRFEPVVLPGETDRVLSGMEFYIAGWGYHGISSGELAEQLSVAKSRGVTGFTCQANYTDVGLRVDPIKKFCVGDVHGAQAACFGDLGGPAWFVDEPNYPSRLYGIASFNFACGDNSGRPSGYTLVSQYLTWINGVKSGDAAPAQAPAKKH